jgi:class 3 adenylate cyclase
VRTASPGVRGGALCLRRPAMADLLPVAAPPIAQRRLDPYVPRVLLRHLAETPDAVLQTVDATVVFADISGFTKLSERLARLGREGAEELVETIGA